MIDGTKKKRRTISIRRFKVNSDGTRTLISHEKPRSKSAMRHEPNSLKADSIINFPSDILSPHSQSNQDQKIGSDNVKNLKSDSKDFVVQKIFTQINANGKKLRIIRKVPAKHQQNTNAMEPSKMLK